MSRSSPYHSLMPSVWLNLLHSSVGLYKGYIRGHMRLSYHSFLFSSPFMLLGIHDKLLVIAQILDLDGFLFLIHKTIMEVNMRNSDHVVIFFLDPFTLSVPLITFSFL